MWFQQIIAAYYVFVDTVLVTQFVWYGLVKRVRVLEKVLEESIEGVSISGNSNSDDDEDGRRPQGDADLKRKRTGDIEQRSENAMRRNKMPSIAHTVFITISLLSALAGALPVDERGTLGVPALGGVHERFLGKELTEAIGLFVGWSSTLLYVRPASLLS